jgi:hypothetical protein
METNLDPTVFSQLLNLLLTHKWLAASVILILIIMRIFKGDLNVPLLAPYLAKIPARFRVWIVILLGIASAGVEKVANGIRWSDALIGGVVAAALAVLTHQTVVESIRDGKEIGAKSKSDSPGEQPIEPPSASTIGGAGLVILLVVFAFGQSSIGCSWLDKNASSITTTSCTVIDTLGKACALLRFKGADGVVHEEAISTEELAEFGQAMSAKRLGAKAAPAVSASAAASK